MVCFVIFEMLGAVAEQMLYSLLCELRILREIGDDGHCNVLQLMGYVSKKGMTNFNCGNLLSITRK